MGAASKVVDTVTDTVDQVVDTIDKSVQSALDDPVNTAIRVGATIVGGPAGLAAANAAIAIGQGQSIEDAAKSAGKGAALAAIGSEIGAGVAADTGSVTAGQAAAGASRAILTGGDPLQGAITGSVNSGLSDAAKAISDQNLEDWSRQQAANSYDNSSSPTEQDVLASDPSIKMESPLSSAGQQTGAGYFDEQTGKFIPSEYGQYSSPLTDASGTNLSSMDGYKYDQTTGMWTMPDGTPVDLGYLSNTKAPLSGSDLLQPQSDYTPGAYDPLTQNQIRTGLKMFVDPFVNSMFANKSGLGGLPTNKLGKPNEQIQSPQLLAGNDLEGASSGDPYYLEKLRQLYGSLTPETGQEKFAMASGGLLDSSKTTDNPYDPFPQAVTGVSKGPLVGGGQRKPFQMTPLQQLKTNLTTRMARGGLPQKYAEALPAGHKPEFITGLTGYYASGKGTGQSDDIDAMLHDGDYVADADLVAALGDGSSKAGAEALEKFRRQIPHNEHAAGGAAVPAKIADGEYVFPASFVTAIGQGDNKAGAKILDKMREAIRAHKRSAPTTKIPPKAKSPLDYLKMVKG